MSQARGDVQRESQGNIFLENQTYCQRKQELLISIRLSNLEGAIFTCSLDQFWKFLHKQRTEKFSKQNCRNLQKVFVKNGDDLKQRTVASGSCGPTFDIWLTVGPLGQSFAFTKVEFPNGPSPNDNKTFGHRWSPKKTNFLNCQVFGFGLSFLWNHVRQQLVVERLKLVSAVQVYSSDTKKLSLNRIRSSAEQNE